MLIEELIVVFAADDVVHGQSEVVHVPLFYLLLNLVAAQDHGILHFTRLVDVPELLRLSNLKRLGSLSLTLL